MSFRKGSRRQCPVEGCPGVSETRAAMRVHFLHRHVHDTVHCRLLPFGKLILYVLGPPSRLGGPEVPPWCGLPVSSHQVTQQGSSRDFRPTLPARHSLSLSLPKLVPFPRYSPPVPLRGPFAGPCPTGVTGHADCIIDICLQAYPVKDGHQCAESALEPFGVRRADHPVICVEYRR